jgi:hypothetical protein
MSWTVLTQSFMKVTSLFRMHGLKVRVSSSITKGPTRVKTKVVNQGDLLNQALNQPSWASLSRFLFASPSLTLDIDSLTTPE